MFEKNKKLKESVICVFDVETTGFEMFNEEDPDRIIEIGIIKKQNGQIIDKKQWYINPEGKLNNPDALRVHGIKDEFLRDKPTFKDIAREVLSFIKDTTIVAHNGLFFDFDFMEQEFKRIKPDFELKDYIKGSIDTLIISRSFRPNASSHTLDTLARELRVDASGRENSGFHGALIDTVILADVLDKMIENYDLDRMQFIEDHIVPLKPEYINVNELAENGQYQPVKAKLSEQDLKEEQHYNQFIVSSSKGKRSTIAIDEGLITIEKDVKVGISLGM